MKIIAVCNQKGGTGKTTTAVNLSVALAIAGKKVLLVDLDPQANATSGVGLDKNKLTQGTYQVLVDEEPVLNLIMSNLNDRMSKQNGKMSKQSEVIFRLDNEMSNLNSKLAILPATTDLSGAEIELVSVMGREHRLRKSLEAVKNEFDFIILDSPPSLGLLTINALTAANSVLIPVQCEYYALEGLTQLVNTINLIKENLNSGLEIEGLLLTMADYRTKLTQEVISEVRGHFKDKAYNTVIPRNIRLTESPSFGQPIFVYDRESIGAKKYWELAAEILKNNAELLPVNN